MINGLKIAAWILIGGGAAVYLGLTVLIYFAQEKMIFYPSILDPEYKFQLDLPSEEKFTEAGPILVHSLLVKAERPPGVLIYFHGNGGNLMQWSLVAQEIAQATGWSVWMVDYPGYGKSAGRIESEKQLLFSAQKVFEHAQKENPGLRLGLYGRSIGSGVGTKLASDNKADVLILETPYSSVSSLAQSMFPWLPLFILKYPLTSDLWIKKVQIPILIFHGTDDEIIPYAEGEKLAQAAPHGQLVTIRGGHHNDLSSFAKYWEALEEFFIQLDQTKK